MDSVERREEIGRELDSTPCPDCGRRQGMVKEGRIVACAGCGWVEQGLELASGEAVWLQWELEERGPGCECGCAHVPDHGACDEFVEGRNGRCVYCDHGEACHPGEGAYHNGLFGPVVRSRWE